MAIQQSPVTSHGLFVTGTDTGIGKTLVASALLRALARQGLRAVGMKPVAAGCERTAAGLVNEDVSALVAASNVDAPLDLVSPYRFEPSIAPHVAAAQAGETISIERIRNAYSALCGLADRVIVEGAGGFLVPLSEREDFGDLALELELPVLLVVGMRLGCLNHALLSAEAVQRRGLKLAGWVANRVDPAMPKFEENLQSLRDRLGSPLAGIIPFGSQGADAAADRIDLESLQIGRR